MVQYIPTIEGKPVAKYVEEVGASVSSPAIVEIESSKPAKKFPSLMNKSELIEFGEGIGLQLDNSMKRPEMLATIRKAKKNGNGTGVNKGSVS